MVSPFVGEFSLAEAASGSGLHFDTAEQAHAGEGEAIARGAGRRPGPLVLHSAQDVRGLYVDVPVLRDAELGAAEDR